MNLSVLIPAYKASNTLRDTLQSALKHLPENSEIIVYLDGHDPKSEEIIKNISDKRIFVHASSENKGVVFARNFLVEKAQGKFIAMLDADDLVINNRFKNQLKAIENCKNTILFTNAIFYHQDSKILKNIPSLPFELKPEVSKIALCLYDPFVNSTMLSRKETILSVGEFRETSPAEDYDFWLRAAFKNINLQRISSYGVKYRLHETQLTKSSDLPSNKAKNVLLNESLKNLRQIVSNNFDNSASQIRKIEKLLLKKSKFAYSEYLVYSRAKPAFSEEFQEI